MPEFPLSPLTLALTYFRNSAGWSMARLARALEFADESLISAYERGAKPLSRERLEFLIDPLGYPPEAVDVFLFAYELIHPEPWEQAPSPVALSPEECRMVDRAVMAAGCAAGRVAAEAVRAERVRGWQEAKKAAEIEQAAQLFESLLPLTREERRGLVEAFPKFWSWALAVRVCEASVKRAAHRADEALELAELAVSIAERVPGEEGWRSRLLGYCWAHVGNARRVGNDLAGADKAFTYARQLWRPGSGPKPELLGDWVLPSMEASLRRAQRRFSEALELVEQARACQGGSSDKAQLTLLMQEISISSRMGDPQRSLAALAEAAPLCETSGDGQMLLALRFNMVDDLCQMERFEDAAQLLPQVRELAIQHANELDLIRVGWLTAPVAVGEGRKEDAIAGLEQVCQDFTARELPYNAALSGLDLAVLLLQDGRTVEVRKLAVTMNWIFRAKGIDCEALAALKLFVGAAGQERATVELARQVIAEINERKRSASHLDKESGRG